MRESTTMLRSQCDALRGLPAEQFKSAVLAIWDYELDEKETQTDPVAVMALGMVKPLIDKRSRRAEAGRKGGSAERKQTEANVKQNEAIRKQMEASDPYKEESVKKKEENIKDKKKCMYFVPPTLEEVSEYIREKGYKVDAEKFVDFYTSKGWMVGKNKMKDWKASVRTWAKSRMEGKTAKGTNNFNNFQPSGTNWESVWDQVMEAQNT